MTMRPAAGVVALTGAASPLARLIVPLLDADPAIAAIRAFDIRPYEGPPSPKLTSEFLDVRDEAAVRAALTGADAVLHLAFIVRPRTLDRELLDAVNIGGTRHVAMAAAAAGARRLIYTSSVAAYGAVPGQPSRIAEDLPLRGEENAASFFYPHAKAATERFLDGFAAAHPEIVVTRFRPHVLTGPCYWEHSRNLFLVPDLDGRRRFRFGFRPLGPDGLLVQFTHESDLARAVLFALRHPLPGAYNIAGEPYDLGRGLAERGVRFLALPWRPLAALAAAAGLVSGRARVARQWLVGARYRNILDCSKLTRAGFDPPPRSSELCIREVNALAARRKRKAAKGGSAMRRAESFLRRDRPGWAVVTGASSGIGRAYAERLAGLGYSILLVARRRERLEATAAELASVHGVAAEALAADLGRTEGLDALLDRLARIETDVLIANAGFGTVGPYAEADAEGQQAMLRLHAEGPARLVREVLPGMIARQRGLIVLTSSLAAFVPAPGAGLYTPSKAFLVGLARQLAFELEGTGVRVQALCPGYVRTEFHLDPAYDSLKAMLPASVWKTPDGVVRASLRAAARGRTVVIPGLANRAARRFIPDRWLLASFRKRRWGAILRGDAPRKDR